MTKTEAKKTGRAAPEAAPTQSAQAAETTVTEPKAPKGKLGILVGLLQRPEGVTLQAAQAATGWQAHSVRGAISGSVKKKLGLTVLSEKAAEGRTYRIPESE